MDHEHSRRPDLSHERLGAEEARGPDESAGEDAAMDAIRDEVNETQKRRHKHQAMILKLAGKSGRKKRAKAESTDENQLPWPTDAVCQPAIRRTHGFPKRFSGWRSSTQAVAWVLDHEHVHLELATKLGRKRMTVPNVLAIAVQV